MTNPIPKVLQMLDRWQRKHTATAFAYGVIKKYGDDEAGYQAALLTYYGFLSLFPLLLVLTTVLGILAGHHQHFQATIINGTTHYFPTFGSQLSAHLGSFHKTGLALLIGMVFTLYGARGVADAFRHGVNHIWRIPKVKRSGFPASALRSLAIIIVGGSGFIMAAIISGYTATAGHGWLFHSLSIVINLIILFWVFMFVIKLSLPVPINIRQIMAGAAAAAVGLVILQNLGSYILITQIKNLSALYSSFAIVLGLLFWIYLQSQMILYAMEIATVHSERLWPRSLTGDLTPADKRAYGHLATKERVVQQETVQARF